MNAQKTRNGDLALLDEVFEPFLDFSFPRLRYTGATPLDLYEQNGKYVLEIAVPGYDPKEINVEVSGNAVSIFGRHAEKAEKKELRYHRREMRQGSFSRTITLPQDLDTDAVDAKMDKGILKVQLTPTKPMIPHRIEVKSA